MPAPLERSTLLADRTLQGRAFCERYTDLVEDWLVELFDEERGDTAGMALVALGGQGRRELAPQSDLDLLLLVQRGAAPDAVADRLWYPIWDAGLKLGHAVRSVRDTLTLASDDLETATALLSARHLAGDQSLTAELAERSRTNWRKRGRRWVEVLARSVDERHRASGSVANDVEPDLKDGRGGLRDVHALGWASAAGAELDPGLVADLARHHDTLLGVRIELHRATAQPGDRLLLQEQDGVAGALGVDADELMARVATAARAIAWASDESWYDLRAGSGGALKERFRKDRHLEHGLVIRGERLRLADEDRPVEDPLTVLRVAVAAARHQVRIGPETLARLQVAPPVPEPWTEQARLLFADLLLTGTAAVEVVETLDQHRIWETLIREWKPNRSRPQRNVYHRFTVDRHLLECAARAADLALTTPQPDLLVLSALLHDIGKGYPGDHSQTGEHLASGIARRLGHTPGDVATVGFLARHHLLLPDVATRRDLDDPATIRFVADVVGNLDRLSLLHALTIADGLATGPIAWSPWKAELVEDLVARTARLLGAPSPDASAEPQVPTARHRELLATGSTHVQGDGVHLTVVCPDRRGAFCRVAGALALHGLDVDEATIHSEEGMALDVFRVHASGARVIPWDHVERDVALALEGRLALEARLAERERSHRRAHRPGFSQLTPGVRFDNDASDRATVIEATGRDEVGLLHRLTRALADLDLDVVSAKIHTMGVDVVDTFYVSDAAGRKVSDDGHQAEIRRALLHVLDPPA